MPTYRIVRFDLSRHTPRAVVETGLQHHEAVKAIEALRKNRTPGHPVVHAAQPEA